MSTPAIPRIRITVKQEPGTNKRKRKVYTVVATEEDPENLWEDVMQALQTIPGECQADFNESDLRDLVEGILSRYH